MKYVARRDLVPFPPPHREKKNTCHSQLPKRRKSSIGSTLKKESSVNETFPANLRIKSRTLCNFKKRKKKTKRKEEKKGETARVQSLFIAWKGPRLGGFWGSHSFQGNGGGNCQWSRGGGAVIRILQSLRGGWGNQLNSIVTHPESSDHPSPLPLPLPPGDK